MEKGWRNETTRTGRTTIVHTYPPNDLHAHALIGETCWCRPRVRRWERGVWLGIQVIHHAADGRELVERHGVN